MIRVFRKPEPEGFDENVRKPGARWLAASPVNLTKDRPNPFWRTWEPCASAVSRMFEERCGYLATVLTSGHVDHFISWSRSKRDGRHHLAYEWDNYRWLHPQLNSSKGDCDFVDPFEVKDEWFDLDLMTLNLIVNTEAIPHDVRSRVKTTVEKLALEKGPMAIKLREEALQLYREGLRVDALERRAPMVGRALRKLVDAAPEQLSPPYARLRAELLAAHLGAPGKEASK